MTQTDQPTTRPCDALCRDIEADRDRLTSENAGLHAQLAVADADANQIGIDLTAVRTELARVTADRDRYARTAADLLRQRNETANELEQTRADRDRLHEANKAIIGENHRIRQELDYAAAALTALRKLYADHADGPPMSGDWLMDQLRELAESVSTVDSVPSPRVEGAFAEGYAEAVARLRDDEQYRHWWTARTYAPDARYWETEPRGHLADYLKVVGPDGPDVTKPLPADTEAERSERPCPRCGSPRWVSVSLDGGWTCKAQCVPCGAYHPGTIGPGWKSPRSPAAPETGQVPR